MGTVIFATARRKPSNIKAEELLQLIFKLLNLLRFNKMESSTVTEDRSKNRPKDWKVKTQPQACLFFIDAEKGREQSTASRVIIANAKV